MPAAITLRLGSLELSGHLNDAPTAQALLKMLPANMRLSRWGEEYYGSLPQSLDIDEAPDAREEMAVGELAYWPPGNALCLFFGPTPASVGSEPRAASPVNPIGSVSGDLAALRKLGHAIGAQLTLART